MDNEMVRQQCLENHHKDERKHFKHCRQFKCRQQRFCIHRDFQLKRGDENIKVWTRKAREKQDNKEIKQRRKWWLKCGGTRNVQWFHFTLNERELFSCVNFLLPTSAKLRSASLNTTDPERINEELLIVIVCLTISTFLLPRFIVLNSCPPGTQFAKCLLCSISKLFMILLLDPRSVFFQLSVSLTQFIGTRLSSHGLSFLFLLNDESPTWYAL